MCKKSFSFLDFLLYALLFIAEFSLFYIGNNGEPFAITIYFSALFASLNPYILLVLYILSSLAGFSFTYFFIYVGQAILLFLGFYLKKRFSWKSILSPFLSLFISLCLFVAFSPFNVYLLPDSLNYFNTAPIQKFIISAIIFLLSSAFVIAMRALIFKILKCRLKNSELIFISLLFICVGIGIARAAGIMVYLGIAFFFLLLFAAATKDASTLICAFVLSIPAYLCGGISLERFFVYGIAIYLLINVGRFPSILALICVFLGYGYLDGIFTLNTNALAKNILSVLIPSLLFLLIPNPAIRALENKLIFYREKHLSRIAINRNRSAIGEKLFDISGVFREIKNTFSSLGATEAQDGAKNYIKGCMIEEVCKNCTNYKHCSRENLFSGLDKLIEVGCLKGKVSLLDIPKELSNLCTKQSDILYSLNPKLSDYRKYMLETENANDGRMLLAKQAEGISEILKNIALEQSQPLILHTDKEHALDVAFSKSGIVCSEILVSGEEDFPTLSLITFGKSDVKLIAAIASDILSLPMIISERLSLNKDKFCCILRKKPRYDAAFGIASTIKSGENASGDSHSVIKIDERKFMIALSDGMGSGEYARRISESTISLLESFYRAKMPSPIILSTINKLITFSKEETFACVDIAVVDLDEGNADIIKIGSPMGFILSGNTLKILESASLPLGILESIHPSATSYPLLGNDILLFLSDGITSAFPSSSDLYESIKHIPSSNPQQIADSILKNALNLYNGIAKDDMTVMAVRIFENR